MTPLKNPKWKHQWNSTETLNETPQWNAKDIVKETLNETLKKP